MKVPLTENEINAFDEDKDREHRKVNVRDGYIPHLLADEKYRNVVLQTAESWTVSEHLETTSLPYYKIQVKLMDAYVHSDKDKLIEYSKELKNLDKNNNSDNVTPVSANFLNLGYKTDEEIRNITNEDLESILNYIEENYPSISDDSMFLSSLLKILLQIFTYKFNELRENNRYDFCIDLIYKIINTDKSAMDPVHISSIIHSLTGLLGIKIYYEIENYDKNDLMILYQLLSLSIFQRLGYTKESSASVLFKTLNKLPIRGARYNYYVNLLDFILQTSITKRKYLYSDDEARRKYENKRVNSLIKKHLELKKINLYKIQSLDSQKDLILEDFLPSLLFASKHFKYFNKADRNFSKIYEHNLEKILFWNINFSKIGYEDRGHSNEYSDWYEILHQPIFNLKWQYPIDVFNKYIDTLVDNKKYIPNLLGWFTRSFFNKENINRIQNVKPLKEIFKKILDSEKVNSSTERNFITNIMFCSYSSQLLEDSWGYFIEFTEIIDKWVKIYGGDWHYYPGFLSFVKYYHSKYSVKQILEWLDYILTKGENSYERLFEHYGSNTLYIMQLLKENYDTELQDKNLKRIFVDIVNKLVNCNVSTANELQQSL